MRLYDTQLGKWLALVRIQSTPLTFVSLSIGYVSVTQSLEGILPLIVIGALGHWGFYALNDIYDRLIDEAQGKENKPLVSGDITSTSAQIVSLWLIVLSIICGILWLPTYSLAFYLVACVLGWYYNKNSKRHTYSAFYLGGWGAAVIFTGALYAGAFNMNTLLIGLLLAVHMVWMTVIGDIKDIESDEPNLVHKYDCHITKFTWPDKEMMGEPKLFKSIRFQLIVALPLLAIQGVLALFLVGVNFTGIYDLPILITVTVLAFYFFETGWTLGYNRPYSNEDTTRDIVINELLGVGMLLTALLAFTPPVIIAILLLGSVVWGLSWQKIQYGSALYFP